MTTSVSISRLVGAEPERAFRAFTQEIGEWYRIDEHTVVDHRKTVTLRFEPFVGGRFVDVHDATTGDGLEIGRIQAWEPPVRLQFVDRLGCEVEVTFVAVDLGTRVTIDLRGLDHLSPDVAEHVEQFGWHILTPWFADYLARPIEQEII